MVRTSPRPALSAAWLMVVASFLFATMGLCVKMAATTYSAGEIVFYRGLICMVAMWTLARVQGHSLRSDHAWPQALYSLSAVSAIVLYFYSIAHLPLATALTLNYTAPLWMGVFLIINFFLFGGQHVNPRLLAAIALGLLGTSLILQPSFAQNQLWPNLAALTSGILVAASYLLLPALARKGEPEVRTVFYLSFASAVLGFFSILSMGSSQHSAESLAWLIAVGLLAAAAQLALTLAYSKGRGLLMASLQYTGVAIAYGYGISFFNDPVNVTSLVGITLVVGACLASVGLRELRQKKAP